MDERTLVADVKSYIDELQEFRAEVEEHDKARRSDLTVYYKGKILFSGEFKRPTSIEGKTPFNADVVEDAFLKASNSLPPSRFFITSNFNETVIWDSSQDKPLMSRDIDRVVIEHPVKDEKSLETQRFKEEIRKLFQELAKHVLSLNTGKILPKTKPLGESFIYGLNDHLSVASKSIMNHIKEATIRKWWSQQKYSPLVEFDDADKERMAKYVLYVFTNKIVFYYVLKRQFPELGEINVPKTLEYQTLNPKDIKTEIYSKFDEAKKVSGDYETVFGDIEYEEGILFEDSEEVYYVISIIRFLQEYNLSSINQDVLGNVYDRLIEPEERHNNGQYYTPIPVVDLINALTIKTEDARVMDPACGSGTFLSRAFDYKLKLYGKDDDQTREKIIKELFGVDIAPYPVHLATVSLASKQLTYNPQVYPNILKEDFIGLQTDVVKPKLRSLIDEEDQKTDVAIQGLDEKERKITFKPLDAVVGNLPYIRQEEVENKDAQILKIENFLKYHSFPPDKPNNGSDFLAYFYYYLVPFLKEGSRVGFLTSDTWLNVDYGDDLKMFINKYFKIIAVIDSSVERWFEDAEVNTLITVLERTDNKEEIANNKIKFARITDKIENVIKNIDDAIKVAKNIENGKSLLQIEIKRTVRQADIISTKTYGTLAMKMYPYLRGTEQFFELINNKNMVPLNELMDIKRGFTTGANAFFYVTDVSEKYSSDELYSKWKLRKGELKKIRIIRSGDKSEHLIEKEYLKPILKGPKEFTNTGKINFTGNTKKMVFLVQEDDKNKIKQNALKYLEYGESNPSGEPYSERDTCRSRNYWWKLSPAIIPDMALGMYFSSNFLFPKVNALLDATLYLGNMNSNYNNDLSSVYSFLNSSLSYLYPDLLGRNYGGGATGFMVYETELLPVISPELLRSSYDRIQQIMVQLENRKVGSVFEEIWDGKGQFSLDKVKEDRLELDRLLLKAIGIQDADSFLLKWYPTVIEMVNGRLERAKSVKTRGNKKATSMNKIADNIMKRINVKKFPEDYIDTVKETLTYPEGSTIKQGNDLHGIFISIDGDSPIYFEDRDLARYTYYCLKLGLRKVQIPSDPDKIVKQFEDDIVDLNKTIVNEIAAITSEKKHTEKLIKICVSKTGYGDLIQEIIKRK
jgi:hypothetical protein